jgi:hypothetical protein
LPLTMQAIGTDVSPLSFRAFASDVGVTEIFVGFEHFIDISPPSLGTKFLGAPDTLTAVIGATALQSQTVDAATSSVPILGANGLLNNLSMSDTATVTMFGAFGGIARAFASTTSDCLSPLGFGTVNSGSVSMPNVPINREEFLCVTGSGGGLASNPNGFSTVIGSPGTSTDFLSANAINEFPGAICYSNGNAVGVPFSFPTTTSTPTLSSWGMIGLTGMLLSFGAWKLKRDPQPTT